MIASTAARCHAPARRLRALAQALPLLLAAALPAAQAEVHSWTSGEFQPGVTAPNPIPLGDTLLVSSVSTKILDGLTLQNDGHITWTNAGTIRLQGGAALINNGVFERRGTTGSAGITAEGTGGSFINNGWVINDGASVNMALSNGELVNNGTIDNRGGTFVLPASYTNTGTLMGNSFSIAGTGLVNAGVLAPGSSGIGSLQLTNDSSFVQSAGGTITIDITTASTHDVLDVAGSGFGDATLAGTLVLNCFGACSLAVGDELTVLVARRSISGQFDQVRLNGFATGAFELLYDINAGNDDDFLRLRVTETVSAVPEPSTILLWLAGAGALATSVRRRRRVQ